MNGIEKITAKLEAEAAEEVAAIQAEAQAACEAIKQEFAQKAQEEYTKRVSVGTKDCENRVARLASASDMEARKAILAFKQEQVSLAFERAVSAISSMDSDKYVAFLAAQVNKAAAYGSEELIFNARDKAAVGAAAVKAANALLSARGIPGKLTLAEDTRDIPGGVIIRQGDIEVNCSADTLVQLHRNELASQVAEILFA